MCGQDKSEDKVTRKNDYMIMTSTNNVLCITCQSARRCMWNFRNT